MISISTHSSLSSLEDSWSKLLTQTESHPIFSSFAWNQNFVTLVAPDTEVFVLMIKDDDQLIGIAPFKRERAEVSFLTDLGETDSVSDYLDVLTVTGREETVWTAIMDFLKNAGVTTLILHNISTVTKSLIEALKFPYTIREDKGLKLDLPGSFEDYLLQLSKKQRHELRRKLRRLEETQWEFAVLPHDDIRWETFFALMRQDSDKASFLTPAIETFFRTFSTAAFRDFVSMGRLLIEGKLAATALAFTVNDSLQLYNSAFDHQFNYYSVGLMDKALFIKQSIGANKREFDFLNGDERFKYDLGGHEYPLFRLKVDLR